MGPSKKHQRRSKAPLPSTSISITSFDHCFVHEFPTCWYSEVTHHQIQGQSMSHNVLSLLRSLLMFCHSMQPIVDPSYNTELLTEQLRSLGLYAAHTVGDGNCLFRALCDQFYGSPSQHLQLRKDICDWIESHAQRYEPFCEDERGLSAHLRCMREQGVPGVPFSNFFLCSVVTRNRHLWRPP